MTDGLIFRPEDHTYWYDGQRIPSVTQIVGFGGAGPAYADVPTEVLEKKASLGRRVHTIIENFLTSGGSLTTDDPRAQKYLDGFQNFYETGVYQHLFSELALYHPSFSYAGTIDLIGLVHGRESVLDIKTTYAFHKQAVTQQVAAYANLAIANMGVDRLTWYCLHLRPTGNYKLINVTDGSAFGRFIQARRKFREHYGY